jgi:hypothetical protein
MELDVPSSRHRVSLEVGMDVMEQCQVTARDSSATRPPAEGAVLDTLTRWRVL